MPRRTARILGVFAAVVALAVGLIVVPAGAEDDLTVKPDEVIRGEPGSVVTVATEQIPADLVGNVCDVRIATVNGSSVHPGNVVITRTGDQVFETPGIEDSPEGQVTDISSVTLGETLTLDLRLGADGLSSLGFTVAIDCPEPEPEPEPTPAPEPAQVETPPEVSTPTVLPSQQVAPPADPVAGNPTFTG